MSKSPFAAAIRVQGRDLLVAYHAAERYWERARPGCASAKAAALDLRRVAESCGVVQGRPAWLNHDEAWDGDEALAGRAELYLMLGDDIACPVDESGSGPLGVVVTVLSRGAPSDRALVKRRERRAARSQVRRAMEQSGRGKRTERKAQRGGRPLREFTS